MNTAQPGVDAVPKPIPHGVRRILLEGGARANNAEEFKAHLEHAQKSHREQVDGMTDDEGYKPVTKKTKKLKMQRSQRRNVVATMTSMRSSAPGACASFSNGNT